MSAITKNIPTMSSLEIVAVINEERKAEAEATGTDFVTLVHKNFLAKIEIHPGITSAKFLAHVDVAGPNGAVRKSKCYMLPKREAELMVMSESLKVQTRVYDRLAALEAGALPGAAPRQIGVDPALSAFRTSRAIASNAKTAESICALFPSLGEAAKQTIYAKLVNAAAGQDVVPLPTVENLLSATAVGKKFNVSANAIGKLANAHGLKVAQYGEFAMDKSQHSSKQMPSFRYNAAGVARVGELLRQSAPPQRQAALPLADQNGGQQ